MANRTPLAAWLTVAVLALAPPVAGAQCQCPEPVPGAGLAPVYGSTYAPPTAMPFESPGAGGFYSAQAPRPRRLRRALDLLIDPVGTLRGRPQPSNAPFLDAAPNGVNVGLAVAYVAGASVSAGITMGVPVGLRAGRVLLAGPPSVARDRRETLLWIAAPTLLAVKQRRERRLAEGGGQFFGER